MHGTSYQVICFPAFVCILKPEGKTPCHSEHMGKQSTTEIKDKEAWKQWTVLCCGSHAAEERSGKEQGLNPHVEMKRSSPYAKINTNGVLFIKMSALPKHYHKYFLLYVEVKLSDVTAVWE